MYRSNRFTDSHKLHDPTELSVRGIWGVLNQSDILTVYVIITFVSNFTVAVNCQCNFMLIHNMPIHSSI